MPWDDLRYFLVTAREGGFGAAARRLSVQQSTVSRRIAALEAQLGGVLFDRTAGGTVLTALGRRVLPEAEAVELALTRVGDAVAAREREVEGLVRVAMTETMASAVVIPHVLPALFARHPRLRIDLVIGDTAADLGRREADLALRFFLPPRGDLVARRIARLAMGLVAAPELATSLRTEPLERWPFLSAWMGAGEPFEETWRAHVAPGSSPRLTTNSFHAYFEAVQSGLGVGLLPESLARRTGLVSIALPRGIPRPPALDTWLVTPRALRRVPRVAAVFKLLETELTRLIA